MPAVDPGFGQSRPLRSALPRPHLPAHSIVARPVVVDLELVVMDGDDHSDGTCIPNTSMDGGRDLAAMSTEDRGDFFG